MNPSPIQDTSDAARSLSGSTVPALTVEASPSSADWQPDWPTPVFPSIAGGSRPPQGVAPLSDSSPPPAASSRPGSRRVYVDPETGQSEEMVKATDFVRLHLLGKGDVGKVFLVRHKSTRKLYAMKVMYKADILARRKVNRLLTEWEVLTQHDHPMVARLYYSFQSRTKLYFVMEYCAGGEFFRFLQRQQHCRLKESVAKFYAAEVLLALESLHFSGFVYRDIKPENILMDADGHVLLTDFDLSKKTSSEGMIRVHSSSGRGGQTGTVCTAPTKQGFSSFVGTAEYIAPEIIQDSGHNYGVDWWGFGILIYEMLFGTTPFRGEDQSQTFSNISSKEVTFPATPVISDACKALIKSLLHQKPEHRLGAKSGAAEVRAHKWFKDVNFCLIRNGEAPMKPVLPDVSDPRKFPKYAGDDPLSDGEVDASFVQRRQDSTQGPTSPYSHPAHQSKDPFAKFRYYTYRGGGDGERKYRRQSGTPVSPTLGRCTGFGASKKDPISPTDETKGFDSLSRSGTLDQRSPSAPTHRTHSAVTVNTSVGVDVVLSFDESTVASVVVSPSVRVPRAASSPVAEDTAAKPAARGGSFRCLSPRTQDEGSGPPPVRTASGGPLDWVRTRLRRIGSSPAGS
eukprot:TRINITY_DN17705_c1_g2_i1.p1 TRINITY_DN17705_c1_g2~~TRINITY_DN17705_c1_g2_i1.p1  ORF type:complete len:625 (+),score=167.48 TRINITY_DN17705_c1_g2_i1:172-2046(+)